MEPINAEQPAYSLVRLANAAGINKEILAGFQALSEAPDLRRSHFFAGRFENVYIPRARLPALDPVLAAARRGAAEHLGRPGLELAVGYWFNAMAPGQTTQAHRHDEDDELLSGVYYVQVPEDSGDLLLIEGGVTARLRPQAGQFVFFAPELVHEVSVNRSDKMRLSIGMNFGIRG